jgi:hypothetical protein
MKTLFHECPFPWSSNVVQYETMHGLFVSLGVPNTPLMHWSNFACWIFAKHIYGQVQNATMKTIKSAQYIVCSCDEVAIMDNCYGFVSMHMWCLGQPGYLVWCLFKGGYLEAKVDPF